MTAPLKEEELHLLRRVTVLDKHCSCPLYDKIISWKTDDHSPGTAAKLISLFNSIAITFNDFNKQPDGSTHLKDSNDRVRRVIFEHTSEQQRKSKSNYSKYSTGLPSLGGRTNTSKASTSAGRFMMAQTPQSQSNNELEIFFQTSGSIHVAIFFKPARYIEDGWEPQLLRDISHDFLHRYEKQLKELAPQFAKLAKDQEAARNNYEFMVPFQDFEPTIPPTSGFTMTSDISNTTSSTKKLDLGRHILPLSSDLILSSPLSATPISQPLLASQMSGLTLDPHALPGNGSVLGSDLSSSGQIVQPHFFPQMPHQPTPHSGSAVIYDENAVLVQKEQRNQRRAMQQGLQPPTAVTGPGGLGLSPYSEQNTPTHHHHASRGE